MKAISKRVLFGAAIFVGVSLVLAEPVYQKLNRPPPAPVSRLHATISVSEQLQPDSIPELRERGFTAIIDLRPDGEAPDQTPSAVMARAAHASGMDFVYVPVPHGAIPESAVLALHKALQEHPGDVLLYCRSGKRAARTWGLVEASRVGGIDAQAILNAVKSSGQSADDLGGEIARRISLRASPAAEAQ